jgi:flagellin-like hook-associated protein FlgL
MQLTNNTFLNSLRDFNTASSFRNEANDKDPSKGASWGERYLASQITNQINANGSINGDLKAISNREMVGNSLSCKAGSVLIHSKVRGTSFNSNSQSLTMNSLNQSSKSITLSTTSPNATGTKKEISVRIGADDTSAGGGKIADGDVYRLFIRETHSDEQSNQYNSWFNARTQNYFVTTTSGMSNDDIRTNFLSQINARADSRNGSYSAVAGATGELIISERNAGDSFSVSYDEVITKDFLRKTQDQANVSPFSIEHSMNYLIEMLSQDGAEQSRLKLDLGNVQNHYTVGEQAMSRITDSDFAHEATQLAASSLKSQMASKIIANSSRLKDVLIPLTTEHFRSDLMSSTL